MAWLATEAGWRVMSLVLAGAVIAFLPVLLLLMRDRPQDLGLAPYGEGTHREPCRGPEPGRGGVHGVARRRGRAISGCSPAAFGGGASTNGLIGRI
jgi:hypothetical protein